MTLLSECISWSWSFIYWLIFDISLNCRLLLFFLRNLVCICALLMHTINSEIYRVCRLSGSNQQSYDNIHAHTRTNICISRTEDHWNALRTLHGVKFVILNMNKYIYFFLSLFTVSFQCQTKFCFKSRFLFIFWFFAYSK